MTLHQTLDCSDKKRVFVVGDIHGEFDKLETCLADQGFDPAEDVLISVGDLVDRGPDSMAALRYIQHPWFHRVLGNHETFVTEYLRGRFTRSEAADAGGDWFIDLPKEELRTIAAQLELAPVAMTVITPAGYRVGITHGDCPNNWAVILEKLAIEHYWQKNMIETCLYSRRLINTVKYGGYQPRSALIDGVDFAFHGHTPMDEIVTLDNRSWIDTAACYGGKLSILDMDSWITRHLKE